VAKAREIKRRIKSVDNTRKITRTMEMVATSKLKKATNRVAAAAPYGNTLEEVFQSLHAPGYEEVFPLLRRPELVRKAAVLLLTANRGLAGAFNANLIKEGRILLDELRAENIETELHAVGKKSIAFFRFRGEPMASASTAIGDEPTVEDAEFLIAPLRDRFGEGELDAVYLVGSEFRSPLSTPPRRIQVLPIRAREGAMPLHNFILSPNGGEIIHRLLPVYVRNLVYRALIENAAAEQGARRTAMKSATDNAEEMLRTLTRTYNRARQGQITQEIAEIVGGAAALE
jgi:F-type H+-transporting ATPase subunit gamma